MSEGPIRASEVQLAPDERKSEEQLRREKVNRAVRKRAVQRKALQEAGYLDKGSDSLAGELEVSLNKIVTKSANRLRARRAVQAQALKRDGVPAAEKIDANDRFDKDGEA